MPKVVHFGRRVSSYDSSYDRSAYSTKCDVNGEYISVTRKKADVTCKRCLRLLGIEPTAKPRVSTPKRTGTAWDLIDAIEDDTVTPEPAAEPAEVEVSLPEPMPEPAAPVNALALHIRTQTEDEQLAHRLALVFFHLMRSALGAEQVANLVELARRGVTGQGNGYDFLMPIAEGFARRILNPPPRLMVSPR